MNTVNYVEVVKHESLKHMNPDDINIMLDKIKSIPSGIIFDDSVSGLSYRYSITDSFIKSHEEKLIFLRVFRVIIKILENNRKVDKINFKKTQRTHKYGDKREPWHVYYLDVAEHLSILYELRHFIRSKFND